MNRAALDRLSDDDLLLIPRPARIERTDGFVALSPGRLPEPHIVLSGNGDPATPAGQAYTLATHEPRDAGSDGGASQAVATIEATTSAGVRHGRATLAQLWTRFAPRLPLLRIEDRPTFAVRGVMLDVSRDRVPTMQHLFETVDTLAGLKINHLQLYTEHTFAYAGHEAAWQGHAPLTPAEIRRLDDYCFERGIELAANQNCFGHLAAWLKLPEYAHLAETHGDWMFDVWPRSGPFSLCPTDPASLAFVEGLLGQLLPCFRSRRLNIGCDETYDVGFGRSKAAVDARGGGAAGRSHVYAAFVARIAASARRIGGPATRPMFWADIALSHPQRLADLPANLTALAWGYEPDSPFDRWCSILSGGADVCFSRRGDPSAMPSPVPSAQSPVPSSRPIWLCPGTSSWRSIFGRTTERRGNIDAAARAGLGALASGANVEGFLTCDWGDTGHQQQWPVAMLGLADGANAAWNAHAAGDFDPRTAALHALGDPSLTSGPWLAALGDADLDVRQVALPLSRPGQAGRLLNQSALFIDMHKRLDEAADVGDPSLWQGALATVESLAASLPSVASPLLGDELSLTARVALFAARRAWFRRSPNPPAGWRHSLAADLDAIMADHARTWLARSRRGGPGKGLDHSLGFYSAIRASLA
ncbi:MAG: family 20 glycosylhydrolase [Phycisphaerales bacterium]